MKINKSILGLTGEYYVAAELGKRNIYAQLTLGNQKKTDLLIFSEENERILRIEVKCKQGNEWPNCLGITQKDSFIVFVDFKNRGETKRPHFYILDLDDWTNIVNNKLKFFNLKNPNEKIIIENNVLVFLNQINKQGKPYRGVGIKPIDIDNFKERWDKIINGFYE